MDVKGLTDQSLADAIQRQEKEITRLKVCEEEWARFLARFREQGIRRFWILRKSPPDGPVKLNLIHLQPKPKKRKIPRLARGRDPAGASPIPNPAVTLEGADGGHDQAVLRVADQVHGEGQVGKTDTQSLELELGREIGRNVGLFAIEGINRAIDGFALRVARIRSEQGLENQRRAAAEPPPVAPAAPPTVAPKPAVSQDLEVEPVTEMNLLPADLLPVQPYRGKDAVFVRLIERPADREDPE